MATHFSLSADGEYVPVGKRESHTEITAQEFLGSYVKITLTRSRNGQTEINCYIDKCLPDKIVITESEAKTKYVIPYQNILLIEKITEKKYVSGGVSPQFIAQRPTESRNDLEKRVEKLEHLVMEMRGFIQKLTTSVEKIRDRIK